MSKLKSVHGKTKLLEEKLLVIPKDLQTDQFLEVLFRQIFQPGHSKKNYCSIKLIVFILES